MKKQPRNRSNASMIRLWWETKDRIKKYERKHKLKSNLNETIWHMLDRDEDNEL